MKTVHWLMLLPSLCFAGYILWQIENSVGLDSRTWRTTNPPSLPWIIAKWLCLFLLLLILGLVFFIIVAATADQCLSVPFPFTN